METGKYLKKYLRSNTDEKSYVSSKKDAKRASRLAALLPQHVREKLIIEEDGVIDTLASAYVKCGVETSEFHTHTKTYHIQVLASLLVPTYCQHKHTLFHSVSKYACPVSGFEKREEHV